MTKVSISRSLVYEKFVVINTIFDPVEVRIRFFSLFEFDSRVSEVDSSVVLRMY